MLSPQPERELDNRAKNFQIIIPEGIGNCAESSEVERHLNQNVSSAERRVEPTDSLLLEKGMK
jgi:hypothetical protein